MRGEEDSSEVRVARGAEWLDEKAPGWERRIDLSTLDLGDGYSQGHGHCIVCQVTGAVFHLGLHVLVLEMGIHDVFYGFNSDDRISYKMLDAAWTSLIKTRFDTGTLSDNYLNTDTEETITQ